MLQKEMRSGVYLGVGALQKKMRRLIPPLANRIGKTLKYILHLHLHHTTHIKHTQHVHF